MESESRRVGPRRLWRWWLGSDGYQRLAPCTTNAKAATVLRNIVARYPNRFMVDFASVDDYLVYRDHPDHRALIAELVTGHVATRAAVQYLLDD